MRPAPTATRGWFASIDPPRGKMGVRGGRSHPAGVTQGLKFHPARQSFFSIDGTAYQMYEIIAEHELGAGFHGGHSGIGTGMPQDVVRIGSFAVAVFSRR
jgi:uncharacterized protein